jgi:hypothetical protein
MKRYRMLVSTLLALVAILTLVPSSALAGAAFTDFEGDEIIVALLDPGVITPVGPNYHGRGRVWEIRHETNDARVTGTAIVVSNGNFTADFTGPAWGTFRLEPDGYNGTWEAVWHSPPGTPELIMATGRGTGDLEGLKAKWTFEYSGADPNGHITGRILDPHGD